MAASADAVENGTDVAAAATPAPAGNTAGAYAGTAGDLVGTWAVSGPTIHNKPTLEFANGGSITIKDVGGSESQMGGHIWGYANGAVTFNGGGSINDLDVSGTWKLQWVSATEFKTTDANGAALTLDKR